MPEPESEDSSTNLGCWPAEGKLGRDCSADDEVAVVEDE